MLVRKFIVECCLLCIEQEVNLLSIIHNKTNEMLFSLEFDGEEH